MSEGRPKYQRAASSNDASHPSSGAGRPREKKRVGFIAGGDGPSHAKGVWSVDGTFDEQPNVDQGSAEHSGHSTPGNQINDDRHGSVDTIRGLDIDKSHLPELSLQQTRELHEALAQAVPVSRPRPAIRRTAPAHVGVQDGGSTDGEDGDVAPDQRHIRRARAQEAFERGKRLEQDERSVPPSGHASPERRQSHIGEDIPLEDLGHRYYSDTDSDDPVSMEKHRLRRTKSLHHDEAHRLVRKHTRLRGPADFRYSPPVSGMRSGAVTPTEEQEYVHDYKPRPEQYRGGVLGALLRLYNNGGDSGGSSGITTPGHRRHRSGDWDSAATTPQQSPPDSGTATPAGGSPGSHWFSRKHKNHSSSSLARLIGSSASLSTPAVSGLGEQVAQRLKQQREQERRDHERRSLGHRVKSSGAATVLSRLSRHRGDAAARITVHIAETIARQQYLMRLCRALMMYGAPTHRLEEYMKMSSRVLEVEAQFLYIPGSMIMSFDDPSTHTTEVKLVKVDQGLDLGRLRDVHEVYKEVVHDVIGVDEATSRLKRVMGKPPKYSRWLRVLVYGLAAASVGPFAFSARLIDLPMAFVLGCILGVLQLVVAPASDLYANVFEVAAAVILSFLSRALGSIPYKGGRLFCFSALAQSSIALILPGYIVLCASLELQSKKLVAGSVRMVYAIIYSLFLGFGLTVGIAIYGLLDKHASSEKSCPDPIPQYWFFFFVPVFAWCLAFVNQAKWKQMPAMVIIAFVAYVANYFSSRRFAGNTQISSTLGALVIGVMANMYSRMGSRVENWALDLWNRRLRPQYQSIEKRFLNNRLRRRRRQTSIELTGSSAAAAALEEGHSQKQVNRPHKDHRVGYSLAAAAMLPAIFVQVPSGLGIEGSLVAGVASANQIVGNNGLNGSTVVNSTTLGTVQGGLNGIAFDVGYGVIQVAIGITVGLFLSAIIVYPFTKKRSGLFSF